MLLLKSKRRIPLKEIITDAFVDIHSHLLPGIDDGVETILQSAFILERFQELGIKKVITTPHVMKDVWPNSKEIIQTKLSETQKALRTLGIEQIKLEASAEYMLDDGFHELITKNEVLPLHKKYLLLEMSNFAPPINLNDLLFEIKVQNYTPILAHPERYSFYHNHMEQYKALKKAGVLFQLNMLSLYGHYGDKVKENAGILLAEGLIDFIATDIHNYRHLDLLEQGIPQTYKKGIARIMENHKVFW